MEEENNKQFVSLGDKYSVPLDKIKNSHFYSSLLECYPTTDSLPLLQNFPSEVSDDYVVFLLSSNKKSKETLKLCFDQSSILDDEQYFDYCYQQLIANLIFYQDIIFEVNDNIRNKIYDKLLLFSVNVLLEHYEEHKILIERGPTSFQEKIYLALPLVLIPQQYIKDDVFFNQWLKRNSCKNIVVGNYTYRHIITHALRNKQLTSYRNKIPYGLNITWDESGIKIRQFTANEIGIDGICYEWYNSGSLLETTHYKNGEKHGLSTRYWSNGNKKAEMLYDNGIITKYHHQWYESGLLKSEAGMLNGYYHSCVRKWFESGNLASTDHYDSGTQVGEARRYYNTVKDNGTPLLMSILTYKNNMIIKEERFNSNSVNTVTSTITSADSVSDNKRTSLSRLFNFFRH